jgi:hypothetical protein
VKGEEEPPLMVCGPTSYYADDLHGACSRCGEAIHWRPHVPPEFIRICVFCFESDLKDMRSDDEIEIKVTEETRNEVRAWLRKNGGKR